MATAELREGDAIEAETVRRLVTAAVALNAARGDAREEAKER